MIQYPTNISPQNIAIDTANRAVIVPDISDWVLCHTLGDLNCAVVISPPNMREGENDVLCNG